VSCKAAPDANACTDQKTYLDHSYDSYECKWEGDESTGHCVVKNQSECKIINFNDCPTSYCKTNNGNCIPKTCSDFNQNECGAYRVNSAYSCKWTDTGCVVDDSNGPKCSSLEKNDCTLSYCKLENDKCVSKSCKSAPTEKVCSDTEFSSYKCYWDGTCHARESESDYYDCNNYKSDDCEEVSYCALNSEQDCRQKHCHDTPKKYCDTTSASVSGLYCSWDSKTEVCKVSESYRYRWYNCPLIDKIDCKDSPGNCVLKDDVCMFKECYGISEDICSNTKTDKGVSCIWNESCKPSSNSDCSLLTEDDCRKADDCSWDYSDKKCSGSSSGLNAGYIVLIVFGCIIFLVIIFSIIIYCVRRALYINRPASNIQFETKCEQCHQKTIHEKIILLSHPPEILILSDINKFPPLSP